MIYTVTGAIPKEQLGVTLGHEHLAWDTDDAIPLYFDRVYNTEKVKSLYQVLLPVFTKLALDGCEAVVECSPPLGGQNLLLMQRLSQDTGVKIIPNTGVARPDQALQTPNDRAEQWISDFQDGLDTLNGIRIRPGHIKILLGNARTLPEYEQSVLRAAVIASNETGMPIHCHFLYGETVLSAIPLLKSEGCDFSRFLWAHAGNQWDFAAIEEAWAMGMWLGFDQIRPENYAASYQGLKEALRRGYRDRILLSQDYDFRDEVQEKQTRHSCASFFTEFLPGCERNGISVEDVTTIMVQNPGDFYDIP